MGVSKHEIELFTRKNLTPEKSQLKNRFATDTA